MQLHVGAAAWTISAERRRVNSGGRRSELGRDPRYIGGDVGITAVLHTWSRELRFHPHVHCIVTGGGLAPDGSKWVATKPSFLFPKRILGALFRGKFLAKLQELYDGGKLRLVGDAARLANRALFARIRDRLYKTRWVAYAKPPFGGPEEF